MAVPFGFSLGDFITVAKLTKDIVSELQKDSKATSNYQNLVVELETLGSALNRICEIKPAQRELIHLNAIRAATKACQRPLENFLLKIRKYEDTMGTWNAEEKRFEGIGKRVQYSMTIEDDVQELRATLLIHIGTITIQQLTQTISCLTTAETDRAKIARSISQSTLLLKEVNEHQKETNQDLKTQNAALKDLHQVVHQSKDINVQINYHQLNTSTALQCQKEAFKKLRDAVEQSIETNEKVLLTLTSHNACSGESQVMTKEREPEANEQAARVVSSGNEPVNARETQEGKEAQPQEEEIREIKAEFGRLERELRVRTYHLGGVHRLGTSSMLDTTSKILNLVLSGIVAASAWTLMNQSQQIAQLSQQILANCTPSTSDIESSRPTLVSAPSTSRMKSHHWKAPTHFSTSKGVTFIVRVQKLNLRPGPQSTSFSKPTQQPPASTQGSAIEHPSFFRWKNGNMEGIVAGQLKRVGSLKGHSVASVYVNRSSGPLHTVDFDVSKFNVEERKNKDWGLPRARRIESENPPYLSYLGFAPPEDPLEAVLTEEQEGENPMPPSEIYKISRLDYQLVADLLPIQFPEYVRPIETISSGFVGRLPLLIALAALSTPSKYIGTSVLDLFNLMSTSKDFSSVAVTVFYDPENEEGSNKTTLRGIERGDHGPVIAQGRARARHGIVLT